MLDRALEARGVLARRDCRRKRSTATWPKHRYKRLEELLADIALGNRMPDAGRAAQLAQDARRCAGEAVARAAAKRS